MAHKKKARPPEWVDGGYAALPWKVLDSTAYQGASHPAKALLLELMRQLNGYNNGHLQLARSYLAKRGWTSRDVVQRALKDLVDRSLIVETRKGGLSMGPSGYAVTWLPISNFVGLDIQGHEYRKGSYASMNSLQLPTQKNQPGPPRGSTGTASRNKVVPFPGPSGSVTVPPSGPTEHCFDRLTGPSGGNNVCVAITG